MTLPHTGLVCLLWFMSISALGLYAQLWIHSLLCPVILASVSQTIPTVTEILFEDMQP